jgi:DNA-binding IclR family transcriptional regulator
VPGLRRALKKNASLSADIERVRRQKVAVTSDVEPGIRAIAAPVFQGERIMATVAIVGTCDSVPESATSQMVKRLLVTAGELSREFGTTLEPAGPVLVGRRTA